MNKIAFIFPGQGAQYFGMGRDFYEQFDVSRNVYEEAGRLTGLDIKSLCFEENSQLSLTEYTQIAMMVTSHAILQAVREQGLEASIHAGLSLGEYNALLASSVISFEAACRLVRKRGVYMQQAVPLGIGTMAAVLGLSEKATEQELAKIDGVVQIANYNCPGQVVISGEVKAVERAKEKLLLAGAKRVISLNVSGPFHSKLLKGAGDKLAEELEPIVVSSIKVPYVSNVTANLVTDEKEVKDLLKQQVYSSVRWKQSVERMIQWGAEVFIEIGPGKTLTGFMKKINRDVKAYHIETISDMNQVFKELKEAGVCCREKLL